MANVLSIQNHINKGFSKAGRILGDQYDWYRPNGNGNPIVARNYIGTVPAAFANDKGLMFTSPSVWSTAITWYGFHDKFGQAEPGDYFVGQMGTLFVTDIERFVSLHCVWTNRVVNVGRALQSPLTAGVGAAYGGASVNALEPVLTSWPAALVVPGNSGRARDAKMDLPSDALVQFYLVLLPPQVGDFVQWNDIVSDDLGRRYGIHGIEPSPMGLRLMVEMWPGD